MALKDWKKSPKYHSEQHTIISNILPQYKAFQDNYYLTYGYNGETFWVSVNKEGVAKSTTFKTKKEMMNFVKNYIRIH